MAQSGAVGYGSPPWVGHVGGAGAPPSPRVLPRPAPPPRPNRAATAAAGEGIGRSAHNSGVGPDTPPVKGCEYSAPWDSPSSTASSSYFSYSSASSCMSPPPSASSPLPPCNNIPASPLLRVGEGRSKNALGDSPCPAAQNHKPATSEAKKPTPAPRSAVKVERCEEVEERDVLPEDNLPCDAGALEEEVPPEPQQSLDVYSDDEEEEEDERENGRERLFRRPSEGTGTSVIRRRATVEVRSVAVQTPSALMSNAFDSRATYPRAKGQSNHWRVNCQDGEAVTRSMDGQDGQSTSLVLTPRKKTSAPACEWHCSFVGGEGSTNTVTTTTTKTTVTATTKTKSTATTVETKTDERAKESSDSPRLPRRGSEPYVDRRGDDEDVAAKPADSPSREEVGKESRGDSRVATVAKASVSHQRVSSRAELCPAPLVTHSDPQISSNSENNNAEKSTPSTIKIRPDFSSQSSVNNKPSSNNQTPPDDHSSPSNRTSVDCPQPVSNQTTPLNGRVPYNSQTSVNSQQSSSIVVMQSNPSSPRKPATPPAPSRRLQTPQQSPKLPPKQSEPSSPTAKDSKPSEFPTPARLHTATSTPKSSSSQSDPRHQSPLTHWLSDLRSSKDAVEDEEGGVTMEEKHGREQRRPVVEVELRGGSRAACERALNRSRRGSGGEISIYEDACSCLDGECCCGVDETSDNKKDCDSKSGRGTETSKVGGFKGLWGMDGAALDASDGVCIRGGLRTRGEGISSRLSALGLKVDSNAGGGPEGNKDEPEKKVSTTALSRRTISEGMAIMGRAKFSKEFGVKDKETPPEKEATKDEPKTNGLSRKTSSSVYSPKAFRKASKIEREDGTTAGSPTSQTAKSSLNGKPPSGSPTSVYAPTTTRSEGQVIRSLPEDDDDWPRRSKFTEDDMTCDDGDGLIILPGTPEGHRSRISQSDSFRSTTSSESKLSSASATSSSQEIPTTGGYGNNTTTTSSSSVKSSSCDNVSLSSSSGGDVSLQQRPLNLPPRVKPPRKNLKPKEPLTVVESSEDNATKTVPPADRGSETVEKVSVSSNKVSPAPLMRETTVTQAGTPKSILEEVKSPSKTGTASGDAVRVAVSECEKPLPSAGDNKSSPKEKLPEDKGSRTIGEKDIQHGKSGTSEGIPWEAGRGRKVACPVAPASPRLPPAKPGRDKPSVASPSVDSKVPSGARLSEDPSDGGSELSLESAKRGDEEEDEEADEEEEDEEEEGAEAEDCGDDGVWKGVYVRGRRKGSYSSDIEAWKRGLSGWCSVEDEEEFLECTKFDTTEESSLSVGCGTPDRSAEEWYSSNDMEGRVYFFEENSNESSWTLPEVTVVSQPQTPPPVVVSGSPAGSDSFISGRSSGGEEGTNGSRDLTERDGSSHSVGGGGHSLVGVSRDDMVAMPIVKMKMDQWEKGGRLIQLRDGGSLEKDLRVGVRSSRAAKTRSMVIGDPGVGEVRVPLPAKVPSAKDWPQLWDGNMYVLREGTLSKTKITENKKRVRKNWAPSHVVLTELFLLFFKDAKTFAALKAGSVGGSISPGDTGAMPELCVDLNGALVDREDQLSSRRNVFRVSTVLGLQVLCQDDNAQNADAWYQDISEAISKLPSGFDGSPRQQNPVEIKNFLEPNSPDEQKKFSRIGRSKSVKVKKDASMEDLSATNSTERQVKIKARLKKFFHRRPTMETLVKKGIWKDEPAFGSYLEQVSGEGIPRLPLFVQRCIAAIESKPENMKADGLYRASGNLSQVQKIRLQVDQNNLSVVDMEEDVHVLTGALKLFFRELKEPLIPYSLFNRALTASTNPNKKEQLHEFKEIVKILPVANYDTLKYLLQHLLRVTSFQEFNRMHIANLAIVFGPTLMWPKQESLNMALDLMQQNLVIECLLQEFDAIFSTGR